MLSMSLRLAEAGVKARQRFFEPVRSLAAGNAPAAAFVLIKADRPQRKLDDAGLVVDDHHARRAEHRAGLAHLVEVHADVDLFGQQHRSRRAAGDDGLQSTPAAHAARYFVDHLFEVVAHGQLVDAGPLNVAANAEETRPAIARRTNRRKGRAAHRDHVRHGRRWSRRC